MRGFSWQHIVGIGLVCALVGLMTFTETVRAEPADVSYAAELPAERGLAMALRAALDLNPSARSARSQVEARRGELWSAQAARLPSINGRAGSDDTRIDRGTLTVTQPLFAFGRIHNGVKRAALAMDAEAWGFRAQQRRLIEDTAMAYARIQGIRARSQVAQDNIEEHERFYERIQRRRTGQLASDTDVGLAYSRLLQARAIFAGLEGELAVAQADLEALTQSAVDTEPEVEAQWAELPNPAAIEALALDQSADLRERKVALEALRRSVSIERASALPTLSARLEQNFSDRIRGSEATRVGFVFEGNVEGIGFSTFGRVRGATAEVKTAEHDLASARIEVARRVRTLIANRALQKSLSLSQQQAVDAARATKESFERQFESGHKTWLELLNIQRELADVGTRLASAENEWLVVSLQIAAITGRLDALARLELEENL